MTEALEVIALFCLGVVAACFSVRLIVATAVIVRETILDARKEDKP